MTARIQPPGLRAIDANGIPISGAILYVYDVGTTTLKSIYSDSGLSVALTNPLSGVNASDASGYFPVAYLASGTYKLVCITAAGVSIPGLTADNLDTGLTAGSGALAISAGGTGATTAAAARTALAAAAQSDVDALSASIATISAALQNVVSIPQGRLTPTTATPIIAAGVTAGTSVYYTPYIGNLIPLYDGTQFNATVFAELTLSLVASHLASQIYDVWVWSESGTVTIGTGPAWTTATAGSCSRGTGAGTTELVRTKGLWTNANSLTTRNGSTTYTVAATKATYVGSIFMDGTNGQISCLIAYGQSRKFGIWNAYNRAPIILKAGDSTASWTYGTATYRASNGSAANSLTVFQGIAEETLDLRFNQTTEAISVATVDQLRNIGIGWNTTATPSGRVGYSHMIFGTTGGTNGTDCLAEFIQVPSIGINTVSCLEKASAVGSQTLFGSESGMILTARWRG